MLRLTRVAAGVQARAAVAQRTAGVWQRTSRLSTPVLQRCCAVRNSAAAVSRLHSSPRAFSTAATTDAPTNSTPTTAASVTPVSITTAENAPTSAAANANADGNGSKSNNGNNRTGADEEGPDLNSDPLGSDRGIAWWLFACSGLVFGMVSLGGLTRLTKSGLSMVEWKPTTFTPPANEEEWLIEFKKYQLFPEYQRVNNQMSLDEFKFIYRMEFYHRLLGRTIGIVFAVPGIYFLARGRINRRLGARLGVAFLAGGAQGAIGWWMVKSGLENPHTTQQSATVHVSPYRLATHLISAFAIYALLFTTALRVHPSTFAARLRAGTAEHAAVRKLFADPSVQRLRVLGGVTTACVALTVFSGAFVAGNEAGLVYNEFPLMGGRLVPQDLFSPYISPAWRNAFENSTMVQFNHRVLALTTAGLILTTFLRTRRLAHQPLLQQLTAVSVQSRERIARIRKAGHAWIGMVTVQVGLGISTLLLYVPVSLATLHQAGSLALLTISFWFMHTLREPETIMRRVAGSKGAVGSRATLLEQLSITLRDLTRGRVHRGTFYALLALLLAIGVGHGALQLADLAREDRRDSKKIDAVAKQQVVREEKNDTTAVLGTVRK